MESMAAITRAIAGSNAARSKRKSRPLSEKPKPQPTQQPAQGAAPNWWQQMPAGVVELLRQLSVNVGQMPMPGGHVGSVQRPAFGAPGQPVMNPDMRTYGQTPGMGEATYFTQSMTGGMTPISAVSPIGVPAGWNPTAQKPKP